MQDDNANSLSSGRRRSPRLEVDGALEMQDLPTGITFQVRDISLGGFRATSARAMRPGDEHVLRITLPGDVPRDLRAQVVHCAPVAAHRPPFIVGWSFARDTTTARHVVAILDHLTLVSTFEGAPK